MSFEIDFTRWSDQAKHLLRVTGRDAGEVLKSEAALFTLDCVRLTPPNAKNPFRESFNVQRRAGERAVQNDIQKIFKSWESLQIVQSNPKLAEELKKYARRGAVDKAAVLLRRLGVKIPVILAATADLHKSLRGAGGRTLRKPRMVLQTASIGRILRAAQKRVGMEKSGWTAAANALGVKLPAWITRHAGPGQVQLNLGTPDNQSITVSNLVPYAQPHGPKLGIIKRAYERRVESLTKRLEHIVQKNFKTH